MTGMSDYHIKPLGAALRRVADNPALATALAGLTRNTDELLLRMKQVVLTEVPEFSKSRNPDLPPAVGRHTEQQVAEIVRLLRGGKPRAFDFVIEHAQLRAEQRFPLAATLHAYRCGHRVVSHWLLDAAQRAALPAAAAQRAIAALADFAIEYTDAISTTYASAYSAHTVLLANVAGDQRAQLLRMLLDGHDEADAGFARILRDAGLLDRRQVYCVALARSVDPTEMLNAARARRMADAIEGSIADSPVRRIIDVHENRVAMVFADVRRESGWTATRGSLAKVISEALAFVGNAALIGISNDVPSTAHVPMAGREAAVALELASVTQRVLRFGEIPLRRLLLHYAGADFRRVLPEWAPKFQAADQRAHGALASTLRSYAAADMNVLKAAADLTVHPNTIYSRLQRIFELTGLQARSFSALAELLIVCDCVGDSNSVTNGALTEPQANGSTGAAPTLRLQSRKSASARHDRKSAT